MNTILGMNSDTFYALLFVLLLVILGVVSFHYYVYISAGDGAAFSARTGVGLTILPNRRGGHAQEEQLF